MRSVTVFHPLSADPSPIVWDVVRELRTEAEESIHAAHHGLLARLRAVVGLGGAIEEDPSVFLAAWDHTPTAASPVQHVAVFHVCAVHDALDEVTRACGRPPDRELVIREHDLPQPSLETRLETFVEETLHTHAA